MPDKITSQDILSSNVIQEFQKLNKELQVTLNTMSALSKEFIKSDTAIKGSATSADNLQRIEQKSNKEKKLLTENEKELIKIEQQQKKILESTAGSYNQLNAQLTKSRLEYKRLSDEQRKSPMGKAMLKDIQNTDKELKKFDKTMGMSQRNVGNYGAAFNGLKSSLLGVFGIFAVIKTAWGVFKSIIQTSMEFHKQMSQVAAITGATREEFVALSNDAKRLGGLTSKTAKQVGELQTEFAKLGFSTKQIIAATEATIRLSEASGADLAQSAKVAASTLNGFGLKANETQRVVDVMAKSFSSSALDMNKFEIAMAQVAPAAKTSGISIEEATAQLGALVDSGLDASTAGTSLRNMYLENAKASRTFDQGLKILQSSTNKNATAMELYGKRGAIASIVLADNTKKVADLTEKFKNAKGSAEEMARVMQDNLSGDVTKMKSAWEGLMLSVEDGQGVFTKIGRFFVQTLTKILIALTDFRNKFVEHWNDLIKSSTIFRTSIAVIGGALKIMFVSIIEGIKTVIIPFKTLGKVIMESLKGNFTAANTALKSGFKDLGKSGDRIIDLFKDTGKNIKDAFNGDNIDDFLLKQKEMPAALNDTEEAVKKVDEAIIKQNENLNEAIKLNTLISESLKFNEKLLKETTDKNNISLDSIIDKFSEYYEAAVNADEEIVKSDEFTFEKLKSNAEELAKIREEKTQLQKDSILGLADLQNSLLDRQIQKNDEAKEKELASAGDNEKRKEQIEKKYAAKNAELKRKQAIIDKAAALFDIAINTAVQVSKAAIPLKPWVIAQGLIQAGIVAAKPIPKFASGIRNFEGGLAEVGEEGIETIRTKEGHLFLTPAQATKMILPKGSDVLTHSETKDMLSNGVSIDKFDEMIKEQKETRKALSKQTKNNLSITPRGWRNTQETINGRIIFIDKYFRC